MMIDVCLLKKQLPLRIQCLKTVDSTNLYLSRLIREGKPIPELVIAKCQTNGQGRTGKSFYSPSSTGLYLTFSFLTEKLCCHDLTPRVALAVREAILQVFGIDCGVKWVNDLYYNDKKVCGILCQRVCDHTLVGIGINVEEPEQIPEEIEYCFGSLCKTCDKEKYTELVIALHRSLSTHFAFPIRHILSEYRRACIHQNRTVTILYDGKEISGICMGIGDDFSILIQINDTVRSFSSGTLVLNEGNRRR